MVVFLQLPSVWVEGHIVLGGFLFRPQGKTGFFFLAKVTGVSGLCDMVWLSFSSHYLGGLSPRATTAEEAATASPLLTAKPQSQQNTQGWPTQAHNHLLPPTHAPYLLPSPSKAH